MKNFEVLWYGTKECDGDPIYRDFRTRKQALDFYNKHKEDPDKFGFWVTHRDSDGMVIEDIIY